MFNIFRLLLLSSIAFNSYSLNASVYNDDILNTFSKILPRFILMSSQKEKIKDEINICILHDKMDKRPTSFLITKINDNYPNGIKDYKIKLIKSNYSHIKKCKDSQLAFLFNSNEENINQALEFSQKNKILTISYDAKLLKSGVEVSLFLGRKITPYINIENIVKKDIVLNNLLLRISKIYSKETN